ncbi:MAG: cyclic nucleotide-binding domain-containing protein [Spirochaetales bacterium]|nr:cyclic nucleotide-binding domain-containing protein [Spirochaetales bacterium]
MDIVKYKKNQELIHEGDIAENMFEIVFGQVGIFLDYGQETQKEIGILSEGDFVGELELIDSSTRIASAVALTDNVTVKRFTIDDFNLFVRENPGKVILMIQQLSGRVRSLDNHYYDACTLIDEFRRAAEEKVPASPELVARSRRFSAAARKRR